MCWTSHARFSLDAATLVKPIVSDPNSTAVDPRVDEEMVAE
jgi:hypothetical protein